MNRQNPTTKVPSAPAVTERKRAMDRCRLREYDTFGLLSVDCVYYSKLAVIAFTFNNGYKNI
uniref:Uncharacterized protein n=1 Tax=Heterorhabditis bacteriophora TaxID=37862 RepID=A0A1I7XSZ8_HETBA